MSKINEQEMVMDWEKQMILDVSKKIKEEIDEKKKRMSSSIVKYPDTFFDLRREERILEEISKYRFQHTLGILEKCGLDMTEFMNSSLFNNPNLNIMLEHIQGKIDGYDLLLNNIANEDSSISFNVQTRIPNGNPIDISKMSCTFANDTLIIESDGVRYEYNEDEHCLIYLNGELVSNVLKKVLTSQEIMEDQMVLKKDMELARLRREKNEWKSLEAAEKFWVKN